MLFFNEYYYFKNWDRAQFSILIRLYFNYNLKFKKFFNLNFIK